MMQAWGCCESEKWSRSQNKQWQESQKTFLYISVKVWKEIPNAMRKVGLTCLSKKTNKKLPLWPVNKIMIIQALKFATLPPNVTFWYSSINSFISSLCKWSIQINYTANYSMKEHYYIWNEMKGNIISRQVPEGREASASSSKVTERGGGSMKSQAKPAWWWGSWSSG